MFTLKRHNVVKTVATEPSRDKLLGQGYTLVEDMAPEPVLEIEFNDESEHEPVTTPTVEEKATPVIKAKSNKGKNSK